MHAKYRVRKGKWLIISSVHILSSLDDKMGHSCSLPRLLGGKLYSGASKGRFLDEGMTKVLLYGFMLAKSYDFTRYCKCIYIS